jgi:molybdopterin biosynthesis enzyme
MPHPRYSSDEIVERGQALYDRAIRDRLDASLRGKFLALDIETGDYEIDADERAALKRALAKHPDAALYLLRIGYPTAYRLGRRAVAAPSC